ncbi:MAG TPA: sulfatase-like hydrolase/transferase [Gemmataceae bacterium]|jgi:arylsulfatase A-like enzyme|nr:sulfatase-like hydrolase/transferase [Gemmataceae bacterium]
MRSSILLGILLTGTTFITAADRKPNILFIVGDDMGYADVGVHGCKDIPTPNIDALANSGVRCTNGYVSGPYCSPTRAGLLTGRYQTRFGHEFNPGAKGPEVGLPITETTIADRLTKAGYATGLVGKWHLGDADKLHPQKRGFDEFFGFLGGAHSYFPGKGQAILRGNTAVDEKEYLTDALGREALAFIDRHKAHPFFLYLAFNAVHTPMHATDARLKKFEHIKDQTRRTYAAMMLAMDEAIGKVMDKLRAEKLENDTFICFISDNGGPTMVGTTINGSLNTPLRGSKRTTLEGGIRVPFFVSWRGKLTAGQTFNEPVIQLDLTATALAAAGVSAEADWKLEGEDLIPFITGDTRRKSPHTALYWRFGAQMAIRKGDWKLVRYDPVADGGKGRPDGAKLYNLADDIGEKNDLAAKEPAKVKELQVLWDEWNKSNVPALWGLGKKG